MSSVRLLVWPVEEVLIIQLTRHPILRYASGGLNHSKKSSVIEYWGRGLKNHLNLNVIYMDDP